MVKPLQARGRLPTEGLPPRRLGDGREQDCAKGEQRSLALQVDCLGACVSSRANGCREGFADRCKSRRRRRGTSRCRERRRMGWIEQVCQFGVGVPSLPLCGQSEYTLKEILGNKEQGKGNSSKSLVLEEDARRERKTASTDLID